MVDFLRQLLKRNRNCKIVVFWDNCGAHRSKIVKEYLSKVNKGKKGLDARLLLVNLAPNAPEENPIETVWLEGKTHIRQNVDYQNFGEIQRAFKRFIERKRFGFKKIMEYRKYYE